MPKKKEAFFRPWTVDDLMRFMAQWQTVGIPEYFSCEFIPTSNEELKRAQKT